jgi:hypothetical protein
MKPIEIVYTHSEYGWDARSTDLEARFDEVLLAGDFTYAATRARVIDALRWSLEDEAVEFEHFVHESAIAAFVAEQEHAGAAKAPAAAKA